MSERVRIMHQKIKRVEGTTTICYNERVILGKGTVCGLIITTPTAAAAASTTTVEIGKAE